MKTVVQFLKFHIKTICMFLIFLACILINKVSFAFDDHFFSYERFFLEQAVIDKIPDDGKIQTEINRFAVNFTNGIYSLSAGNLEGAKKFFLKARKLWPEYFGTDFLLAIVYENSGDYLKAARYYKSYLNKLQILGRGEYRISGPIMRTITASPIERYEFAYERIKNRLVPYEIDIDKVRPVYTFPEFLPGLILILFGIGFYALAKYRLLPYYRNQKRINNPPEGYWVCKNCITTNSDINKACQECRRPRD